MARYNNRGRRGMGGNGAGGGGRRGRIGRGRMAPRQRQGMGRGGNIRTRVPMSPNRSSGPGGRVSGKGRGGMCADGSIGGSRGLRRRAGGNTPTFNPPAGEWEEWIDGCWGD